MRKPAAALGAFAFSIWHFAFPPPAVSEDTAPQFTQQAVNVFRRFAVPLDAMKEFYGDVLGLGALPAINMPGGGQMTRFHVGKAEIKLQPSASEAQAPTGEIRDVTGFRLLGF